tara:strand:- start:173 stop:700 length:528 start_codon:yes stop_codon:yes gene_type:complete
MNKSINLIYIFLILFLFLSSNLRADTIVYIDIDKILQNSKAGKLVIEKLNKTNEKNIKNFKKIEEDIKKEEKDLVAKKNVLSTEEFEKKLRELNNKINDYRETRRNAIDSVTKNRIAATADFAQKIKPILTDYAKENNIDMIIQKKNIIMGKSELDITKIILDIVDKEISKLKIN